MLSNIIKPAKALKTNALRKDLLHQTVSTFLYQINSAIESSNKENKNRAAILLPLDFNLPDCIDYNAFRVETYYNIVSELQNKGYRVLIRSKEGSKVLIIQWDVDRHQDVKHMEQALREISE